jgi:hypothetical protein
MVALFVAGTFLLCVGLEFAFAKYNAWQERRKNAVRFYPDLGLCMADGGDPIKKEKK